MAQLEFLRVDFGPLSEFQLNLGVGQHVIWSTPDQGTPELIGLSAGIFSPRWGSVRLEGLRLTNSPKARRWVGSLLAGEQQLLPQRSLREHLNFVLALYGSHLSAPQLLESFNLTHWLGRSTETLSVTEARTIALLLALHHPAPKLLTLHEPFDTELGHSTQIQQALADAKRKETILLITVSRWTDACLLGSTPLRLHAGKCEAASLPLATGAGLTLKTSQARQLAARLAQDSEIIGLFFCEARFQNRMWVWGKKDIETLAQHILRVAAQARLPVEELSPCTPDAPYPRGEFPVCSEILSPAFLPASTTVTPLFAPHNAALDQSSNGTNS